MRLIFLCALLFLCCASFANNTSTYDPKKIEIFKGQIISVQKFSYINRPVPYVQFMFQSKGAEYVVELGPEWYLTVAGVVFVPREEIELKGWSVTVERKKMIIALEIKKGNSVLKLRNEDGTPLWGMQRSIH